MSSQGVYKPTKGEDVPPSQQEMAEMGQLIEEMMKAGVLLATEGCQPSAKGARFAFREESSP